MAFQFFNKLSKDFIESLNDKDNSIVIIVVQNEKSFRANSNLLKCRSPYFHFIESLNDKDNSIVIIVVQNEKSFRANSNLLKCRSPYFRKELERINPDENNIKIINKPNISDGIFDTILKYIYGGIINLETAETKFILDLLMAADEFELEELTKELKSLIEIKSSWLRTHFSLVYNSIFTGNNLKNLEKFCIDIVVKYPNLVFEDFTSIQESVLISILERDDLNLEEIKIWEFIIKWGNAQNSNLPTNLNEWTKENFTTLKTTLQQCLPLIRYFQIPGTDLLKKIKPYKKILDKQLWDDLKQHFIAPDQPVKSIILPPRLISNSTIITNEHMAEISSWIDRNSKTYSLINIPYKFELILRGSINGFEPQTFWDTCLGYSNTVVIMEVKGTGEILGGYNPLTWDIMDSNYYPRNIFNVWEHKLENRMNYWAQTNDSFIFLLKNGNIQNSILSRVKDSQHAIKIVGTDEQRSYGPCFGDNLCMYSSEHDFTLDNECMGDDCGDYEESLRSSNDKFSIVDYEVFKVIKKTQ
ncbi:hypothetical protein Glove_352g58 [Diversispora epigaea]|uniref:BTB domain-containing protein n=1 Tax=Diversispora epigaea TaxID=1348612 RepID=A0A397HBT6_9GLOM|nr:hypothetical protein Glove_352g58 [Diversispora epigaea]